MFRTRVPRRTWVATRGAVRAWPIVAIVAALTVLLLATGPARAGADRLVVHEWGTFTQLQDENGRALGGINIDDEPLPRFVHNLRRDLLLPPTSLGYVDMKGAPQRHPLVTLRLETPVLYVYPPKNAKLPLDLSVHVDFRGGWLTEFYPKAEAYTAGLRDGSFNFGPLTSQTISSLDWNDVRVGIEGLGPKTDSHVWLAPRQTGSAMLTALSGESEKYLFYRGVGRFDAPLRVSTGTDGRLTLRANFDRVLDKNEEVSVGPLWLVHIRRNGTSAFRTLDPIRASADATRVLTTAEGTFTERDFSADNLARVSDAMHQALVADGLFPDEATAMLETWRQAYFKSPGVRLFCIVPRAWTDYHLPLRLSAPADVARVMVARIELVSPEQRQLLKEMRAVDRIDTGWLSDVYKSPAGQAFVEGRSSFADAGVKIPADYQTYLDLGRFRNALVLAEQQRRPNPALTRFIQAYGLDAFQWSDDAKAKPASQDGSSAGQ